MWYIKLIAVLALKETPKWNECGLEKEYDEGEERIVPPFHCCKRTEWLSRTYDRRHFEAKTVKTVVRVDDEISAHILYVTITI